MFVLDEDSADMQEVERPHQAAMVKHYVGILSGPVFRAATAWP